MRISIALVVAMLIWACDDGGGDDQDVSEDTAVDTAHDFAEDVPEDPGSDPGEDTVTPDTTPLDVSPDPEEEPDAPEDAPADGPRTTDDLEGGDGNSCEGAFLVDAVPFVVTGDSLDADSRYDVSPDSCPGLAFGGGGHVEEVFSFTPETTATYHIRVTTPVFLSTTYVVTDCENVDGTCLGGTNRTNDQWLDLDLVASTTYYVIIDSSPTSGAGSYELSIEIL